MPRLGPGAEDRLITRVEKRWNKYMAQYWRTIESAALQELRQIIHGDGYLRHQHDMMQRSADEHKQPPASSLPMKFVQSLVHEQSMREILNPSYIQYKRYISHAENHASRHLGLFASVVRHTERETVQAIV